MIESRQFTAHANSILGGDGGGEKVSKASDKLSSLSLSNRLDEYYEDPDLVKGRPNLSAFPPSFDSLPCKPLFFDLAREQIVFPNLEQKLAGGTDKGGREAQAGAGGSRGWLGGWLGGWGGGGAVARAGAGAGAGKK